MSWISTKTVAAVRGVLIPFHQFNRCIRGNMGEGPLTGLLAEIGCRVSLDYHHHHHHHHHCHAIGALTCVLSMPRTNPFLSDPSSCPCLLSPTDRAEVARARSPRREKPKQEGSKRVQKGLDSRSPTALLHGEQVSTPAISMWNYRSRSVGVKCLIGQYESQASRSRDTYIAVRSCSA